MQRNSFVLLMAGGMGKRMGNLTAGCPKPLLRVGGKPLVERAIDNCRAHGFSRFYLAINSSHAGMFYEYFGDGSSRGVEIRYIEEQLPMGTAGALACLPEGLTMPLLVMNADILTNINLGHLMDFHEKQQAAATLCVREYESHIPYGVVQVENSRLRSIHEKPVSSHSVSAGIYVFNKEALAVAQPGMAVDMPDFFATLLQHQLEAAAYPLHEYWLDVATAGDLETADKECMEMFQ